MRSKPKGTTKRRAATENPQNNSILPNMRLPGIFCISPVRNAMMKKVEMELTTLTMGRYSTP